MLIAFTAAVGLAISSLQNPMEQRAEALLFGELDPITHDYGAIRWAAPTAREGWERLQALEQAVSTMSAPADVRTGDVLDVETVGCRPIAALGGIRLAKMAQDQRAYEQAHDVSMGLYEASANQLLTQLEAAPSPMDAAVIRDRFWRDLMLQPADPDVDDYTSEFLLSTLYQGLCRADQRNARFLRDLWSDRDRFFEAIYNEDDSSRQHLVQHAPLSLQRDVLAEMERRDDFGQAAHQLKAQAFLTDRVRVLSDQAQLFATQGQCVQGRWRYVQPVDLDAAQERRRAFGLESLEDARLRQDEACRMRLGAGDSAFERSDER